MRAHEGSLKRKLESNKTSSFQLKEIIFISLQKI